MDDMLKKWTQSQKELFTNSLEHFKKNALDANKRADKNITDFERDMSDNRLLRDYIDLGDKLVDENYLKNSQNVKKDQNLNILIKGYKDYHNQAIKTTLTGMAKQLQDARLSEDVVNKRKILDKIFDEIKTRLTNLATKEKQTVSDLCDVVNKKEHGLELERTNIEVYRPEMKRIIAFIAPTCKELEELDNIVPEILKTLANKGKEYCDTNSNLITHGCSTQSMPYQYHNAPPYNTLNLTQNQINKTER